jgi:tRNA-binding EMAP/Myf-like protein
MKFTLSWLKDHLETEASVDEIAETLTDLGLEVEEVEDRGARLADFTIGKVVKAEQHPDADRLRVCQVETDEGVKQIICGAPNARAGITVVVAKPGVYVPGIDTTIGVGKIRGIESFGMMASEREMELSDEHSGIIELPSGEVGQRFVDWLAETRPGQGRPGHRDRDHAEPAGRAGHPRHRAGPRGARPRHAEAPCAGAREGHLPLPGEGGDRRRYAGCRAAFRGPPDPWREERAVAGMAAGPAARHRAAARFRRSSISPTSSPTT